jgi:hypothetical protein
MWISQILIISAFDNAFENNENINLYIHSEKIHKWDQEKCSEFQSQIDLRKIDELKKVIILSKAEHDIDISSGQ